MKVRKIIMVVVALVLFATPPAVSAKGFSFGGGGGRSSFGGSKSGGSFGKSGSGGSKSGGGTKYANGAPKPSRPTIKSPSLGSKPQPASVPKLIPSAPPVSSFGGRSSMSPGIGVSSSRYSYGRTYVIGHPALANPYGYHYYGYYDSPFFYLWLAGWMNPGQGGSRPLPPSSDSSVAPMLPSFVKLVAADYKSYAAKP